MNEARTKYIVEKVGRGITLIEVGNKLGISRERVRQIYTKETGKGTQINKTIRSLQRKETESRMIKKTKFFCAHCQVSVTFEDSQQKKFCVACHKLSRTHRLNVYNKCPVCSKMFHPRLNANRPSQGSKGIFCNMECYNKARKIRATKLGDRTLSS